MMTAIQEKKNDRIRLLHVQLFPMLSGVQRVSLEEFRRLDRSRYELHLVTCDEGPLTTAAAELGVQCHTVPRLKRSISPWNDYLAYRQLRRLIEEYRFDVVHTHSSKTGVLGRLAASAAGVPAVVHTVHGFAFPAAKQAVVRWFYERCESYCGRKTNALICLNGEDERISLQELGVARDRVVRIPNGVDIDLFHPLDDLARRNILRRQLLPGDPTKPLVMMIGRLWGQKNPLDFVRAAIACLQRGCVAEFCLVGEGDLRSEAERLIANAGVGQHIHLLGWRNDVHALMPLADTIVLPSLWEGMPLVLLEAQACGVPIIVSDIPGNRDCVVDGVDGYLVPVRDVGALAEKIEQLLADPQQRTAFGRAAREKIVAEFEIGRRARAIDNLYRKLSGVQLSRVARDAAE